MIRTVAEAIEEIKSDPKRWKVALIEATSTPLLESPDTKVQLFRTKKRAGEVLRDRKDELWGEGYRLIDGGLSKGVVILGRDDGIVGLGIDYKGRLDAK
jgi:hypothetical protein